MGFNKKILGLAAVVLVSVSVSSYGCGSANMGYGDGTFTPLITAAQAQAVLTLQEDINNGLNPWNNFFGSKLDPSDKTQNLKAANSDFVHFANQAGNSPLYLASRSNPELVNLWYRISLLNALTGIQKDLDQLVRKRA